MSLRVSVVFFILLILTTAQRILVWSTTQCTEKRQIQKASLTTIGGLTGGDAPGVALAAAGGSQSQVVSFLAINLADLSVYSTMNTLGVVV